MEYTEVISTPKKLVALVGESTLQLQIEDKEGYQEAYVNLTNKEVKLLADKLNEWLKHNKIWNI